MKRIIQYILSTLLIAFMASYLLFLLLNLGLKRQQNDYFPTLTHLFDSKEKHEIIIIGSSMAKYGINPFIIDSVTGLNSYNLANYHFAMEECLIVLKCYIASKHPLPNFVFLTIEERGQLNAQPIDFPAIYFPYYNEPLLFQEISKYNKDIQFVKKFPYLAIWKYDNYVKIRGINGLIVPEGKNKGTYKGHDPIVLKTILESSTENGCHTDVTPGHYKGYDTLAENGPQFQNLCITRKKIPPLQSQTLLEFCKLCKKYAIKMYFIIPPLLIQKPSLGDNLDYFHLLKPLEIKFGVHIFNYNNLNACFKKSLFYDKRHLNNEGARKFSKIVALDFLQTR